MADEQNLMHARTVFQGLCKALDDDNWRYSKDEENLCIECTARGDDLPMALTVIVDIRRQVLRLLSRLPFVIPAEKIPELAVAVNVVNNRLVDGSFDLDITSGRMLFRMTNSFRESEIGKDLFLHMIYFSCRVIDAYNDKYMMLVTGRLTLEQFLADNK